MGGHSLSDDAAGLALAAAAGPAHPRRHYPAHLAPPRGLAARMAWRHCRPSLLSLFRLVRAAHYGGELQRRLNQHQNTGYAGMVDAGTASARILIARD